MTVPTKAAIVGDKQPVTVRRRLINDSEVLIRLDESFILMKAAWLIRCHQSAMGRLFQSSHPLFTVFETPISMAASHPDPSLVASDTNVNKLAALAFLSQGFLPPHRQNMFLSGTILHGNARCIETFETGLKKYFQIRTFLSLTPDW